MTLRKTGMKGYFLPADHVMDSAKKNIILKSMLLQLKEKEIQFRAPCSADLERMFDILKTSLGEFQSVNDLSPRQYQLIIDRRAVEDYLNSDIYFSLIAVIGSEGVGWLAGSRRTEVTSKHSCTPGEFYIEEILVDALYRRKGIGKLLLNRIPSEGLKTMVVDTPLINERAITFYEHNGFERVQGLPEEYSRYWVRMKKKL